MRICYDRGLSRFLPKDKSHLVTQLLQVREEYANEIDITNSRYSLHKEVISNLIKIESSRSLIGIYWRTMSANNSFMPWGLPFLCPDHIMTFPELTCLCFPVPVQLTSLLIASTDRLYCFIWIPVQTSLPVKHSVRSFQRPTPMCRFRVRRSTIGLLYVTVPDVGTVSLLLPDDVPCTCIRLRITRCFFLLHGGIAEPAQPFSFLSGQGTEGILCIKF